MKKLILPILFLYSFTIIALHAETRQHWVGGDISLLPSYEGYNTPYYDADGKTIGDVITYLHDECGWNAARVRLFVTPTERTSGAKTGVVQDLAYVKKLGKRIKDAGMKLMVDFHYSDCWADPSYQDIPSTWKTNTSNEALADSMYQYTKRCLTELKAFGAEPDFVQVGNEISYGMLWRSNGDKVFPAQAKTSYSTQWSRLSQLLNSGCKAVRDVCPDCKIVIHTERSGVSTQTVNFYNYISDVDYDIIGLSYYPFYHNALSYLSTTLSNLEKQFPNKEVQIVETAYFYQYYASDATYNFASTWAATETGQLAFANDLVAELLKHNNTTGLYWWFPEENGNGGASWNANTIVIDSWLNRGLWNSNNHRALKALYTLKELRANDTALAHILQDASRNNQPIYNICGQVVGKNLKELPKGIYIIDGKKILVK
ncbi:MAG: glycosyl hydrolase 53 family protein [Bacteroidales bacterium]|nr:glycosyl hydrolase 53 family protein [Bacteroidales bacterium]